MKNFVARQMDSVSLCSSACPTPKSTSVSALSRRLTYRSARLSAPIFKENSGRIQRYSLRRNRPSNRSRLLVTGPVRLHISTPTSRESKDTFREFITGRGGVHVSTIHVQLPPISYAGGRSRFPGRSAELHQSSSCTICPNCTSIRPLDNPIQTDESGYLRLLSNRVGTSASCCVHMCAVALLPRIHGEARVTDVTTPGLARQTAIETGESVWSYAASYELSALPT